MTDEEWAWRIEAAIEKAHADDRSFLQHVGSVQIERMEWITPTERLESAQRSNTYSYPARVRCFSLESFLEALQSNRDVIAFALIIAGIICGVAVGFARAIPQEYEPLLLVVIGVAIVGLSKL